MDTSGFGTELLRIKLLVSAAPAMLACVVLKSQPGWLNLPHSPTLPPPVTAKRRVVKFLS